MYASCGLMRSTPHRRLRGRAQPTGTEDPPPASGVGDDLAVHNDEPGVFAPTPLAPGLGHRLQVGAAGQPQLDLSCTVFSALLGC